MKNKVITAVSILFIFSGQAVFAGSISDNYATGDTLTATNMDNIKAAVNDNDDSISINTSNISINSGNITSLSGRVTTLENNGTPEASQTISCGTSCVSLTVGSTATVNVRSVSVNANTASGRVLVYFNGFIECDGTAGDRVYVVSQITTGPTTTPSAVGAGGGTARFTLPDSNFNTFSMNMVTSFSVTSAGTKTYYANARNFTTTSPSCKFYSSNMEAVYIP